MLRIDVAPAVADRVRRATAFLPWVPALLGAAYLVLFVARFPRLIERVYWDSDAATAAVIAETWHGGTVVLERYGWFTSLWFAALTRPLPFHREIWEGAPYLFALLSAALLAWASFRLAGRWAAVMTATAAMATSPFVSYDLVTLNYHTATWTPTVILAVYCLWVTRDPPVRRAAPVALLIGVLAGATLASDHLFALVGLVPFGLVGLLLLSLPRMRNQGGIVLASVAVALVIERVTTWAMGAANVEVRPAVPSRFASSTDLWPNVGRMIKGILQLANGDYFFDARLGAQSALSFACAAVILIALAAPFVLVRRELRSSGSSVAMLVYASFWAACIVFDCVGVVLSSEGSHGGYYLIPVLYATAATAPLVLFQTPVRRLFVCAGVALVAAASLANLVDAKRELFGGLPPVASVADRIVEISRTEGAPVGYADYWDAASLTWSTHMAVRVQPVTQCNPSTGALCVFWFNVSSNWYRPRANTNSFVLRNSESLGLRQVPPPALGPPTKTYQLGDLFTLYLYPYDVASRLDYSTAPWEH